MTQCRGTLAQEHDSIPQGCEITVVEELQHHTISLITGTTVLALMARLQGYLSEQTMGLTCGADPNEVWGTFVSELRDAECGYTAALQGSKLDTDSRTVLRAGRSCCRLLCRGLLLLLVKRGMELKSEIEVGGGEVDEEGEGKGTPSCAYLHILPNACTHNFARTNTYTRARTYTEAAGDPLLLQPPLSLLCGRLNTALNSMKSPLLGRIFSRNLHARTAICFGLSSVIYTSTIQSFLDRFS
jgi:hypothetical protein